jgi:hypothetical protein
VKKKPKPKAKPKSVKPFPPMSASIAIAAKSAPSHKLRPGQAIPAQPSQSVAIVKNCVKFYEETTGAKANQTRLIDFVRWCEDNSGLL